MRSIYESTGKGYTQQGDYLLPNLQLNEETEYNIGIWGQRYRRYLKTQHKVIYYNYLTKGTLYQRLAEVDERAQNMFDQLVKSLAEKENITEQLKENDMLLWVKKMNNIRNRAMEIVNSEVIYV
ncbi:TnpV protein [Thomasclavelia cocleata]|jgi:hypothetical protein|uniref:TnpV protein n=1 Tax=Thomasclavelia cocleata TaxID=69824 RepID=UPI00272E5503|nr:TnpV protein [Thomasclavelia cocleata]